MRARHFAGALALAACCVPAPAGAVEHWAGNSGSFTVDETGRGCFYVDFYRDGAYAGSAAAVGSVVLADPEAFLTVQSTSKGKPAEAFAEREDFVHTTGDLDVCVGGAPSPVAAGSAVYTLTLEHVTGEVVAVIRCTFHRTYRHCR